MEKFLNVCFKVGKVCLMFIICAILLSSILFIFTSLGYSFDMQAAKEKELNYVFPVEHVEQALKNETKINKDNTINKAIEETYKEQINKTIKENGLSNNLKSRIINSIADVEESDRLAYVNNMNEFYKAYIKSTVEYTVKLYPYVTKTEVKKYIVQEGSFINYYYGFYKEQAQQRDNDYTDAENARNSQLLCLLGSIFLFIVALIVPILIRIEENTRK